MNEVNRPVSEKKIFFPFDCWYHALKTDAV